MRKLLKKRNNKKLQRLYRIAKINDMGMVAVAQILRSLGEADLIGRSCQEKHKHKFTFELCEFDDVFGLMTKIIHKRTGRIVGYASK